MVSLRFEIPNQMSLSIKDFAKQAGNMNVLYCPQMLRSFYYWDNMQTYLHILCKIL